MANFIAMLANGGYKYNVSVVKKSKSIENGQITEYPEELIERVQLRELR